MIASFSLAKPSAIPAIHVHIALVTTFQMHTDTPMIVGISGVNYFQKIECEFSETIILFIGFPVINAQVRNIVC
jgi:hypothetical protein